MKVCFDKLLPRDLVRFQALPPNMRLISRLAAVVAKQWVNGSTLRVKFMGGTASDHGQVKMFASEWSLYANIKFVFGNDPASEIRIAFVETDGAWSYIGNDALEIPRDWPTMNLGWLDRSVILHEFGHALACIHEHQNPAGGVQWNREQVIKDLSGPPNYWDANTIEHNMFEKYAQDQINGTVLDPKSIMMYAFPPSWTTNNWHTEENKELSAQDKAFIGSAKMYPKPALPIADNILPISFLNEKSASIGKAGEEDLFQLNVVEHGSYVIETHGDTDCVMVIWGPESKTALLAKDDDSGVGHNSWLKLDLKPATYWISVRHFSKTKTGPYRISATKRSQV